MKRGAGGRSYADGPRFGRFVLLMLVATSVCDVAAAADSRVASRERAAPASPISDRFALRGIYYQPTLQTDARFDSDLGLAGTQFSAEEDFGLDDEANQGRMELMFRIRDRHRLRVDYLKLDRFGESVLTRPIVFRNRVFLLNDRVESNFNFRVLGLTYGWSFWKRENFELGAGVGFHLIETDSRAIVRSRAIREDGSGVGVLPTLALEGSWRFAPRWSVSGRLQYLSVDANDIEGSFADHHVDVQYRWKPNLAIGLGYSKLHLDAQIDDADLPGAFDLDARGPEAFFRVSF